MIPAPLAQAAEAAAAEAGDKVAALQRQLAAAQASLTQEQAAKAAVEGRVTAANTALSEAEAAGQALKEKLKQQEEEATKVGTKAGRGLKEEGAQGGGQCSEYEGQGLRWYVNRLPEPGLLDLSSRCWPRAGVSLVCEH
jgi:hypothetical protein